VKGDAGGGGGAGGRAGSAPDAAVDAGALGIQGGTSIRAAAGPLTGATRGGTRAFFGIPYAKPPVGDLRWRSPVAAEPWTEPRDATAFGATCAQGDLIAGSGTLDGSAEDCLFLNVWAPEPAPKRALPVLVWIHGGGFALGSGSASDYDGQKLVERGGVVVVTLNYRLGAFGFLAHPELSAEKTGRGTSGNYGIEDAILALSWVRRNVQAFGGDPGNVTVFGESAGSIATSLLLVAPSARGLFHRAAMESGVALGFDNLLGPAEAKGVAFGEKLGCGASGAEGCMRGKTTADIVAAEGVFTGILHGVAWSPVADGVVVPTDAVKAFAAPTRVPVLVGSNLNEGTLFTSTFLRDGGVANDQEYSAVVSRYFPTDAGRVLAEYPSSSFASANAALSEVLGDALFVCATRRFARAASSAGLDTYVYSFEHAAEKALVPGLGAFHSSEIPFVFGVPAVLDTVQPDEQPLSDSMQSFWTTFARTGNPNAAGKIDWPKFDTAADENLVLDLPISKRAGHKKARCDFWDTVKPART
jgi:para-nitrobenzyl esterase